MILKEVLEKSTHFLQSKGSESPRLDAELLLGYGLGLERIQLYLQFERPLTEEELALCRALIQRRGQGEPVAYILGYKDFYNLRFAVNSDVLVPRPDTETLIETALDWLKERALIESPLQLLDMGVGSGCIGLTLLSQLPKAQLLAMDISEEALSVAKKNADTFGLSSRVEFLRTDISKLALSEVEASFDYRQKFDLIVANPPYISLDPAEEEGHIQASVKEFEPSVALFAADSGYACIRDWSRCIRRWLAPAGLALMEIGSAQAENAKKILCEVGWTDKELKIIRDLSGQDRLLQMKVID